MPPYSGDLEEINQGFDGFALEIVVCEFAPAWQPMVGLEPMVQQEPGRIGDALVAAVSPCRYLFANGRHAWRGCHMRFKQP